MQTQMAEAMNKALVAQGMKPKTQTELVWRYIKDHPKVKLKTLESVFKRSTAQTVHSLWIRGMVTRTQEPVLVKGQTKHLYCYKVAMPEYELLPLPVKPKNKKRAEPPMAMPLPALVYPPVVQPPPTAKEAKADDLDERINKMPIGEARAMYAKLKAIFG